MIRHQDELHLPVALGTQQLPPEAAGGAQQLGGDQEEPCLVEPQAGARQQRRGGRGQQHRGDALAPRQAVGLGDLEQAPVHLTDACDQGGQDGEEGPDGHQAHLVLLPKPNQMMRTLTHASDGTARTADSSGDSRRSAVRLRATTRPVRTARAPPMPKPRNTRCALMARFGHSRPDSTAASSAVPRAAGEE
jgi:hypothetical protein